MISFSRNERKVEANVPPITMNKPWKLRKEHSDKFMGIGAFNLVKREIYNKIGGHLKIALSPIDDLMLGKLLKKNCAKQDCLIGKNLIHVDWYNNLSDLTKGLQKNT